MCTSFSSVHNTRYIADILVYVDVCIWLMHVDGVVYLLDHLLNPNSIPLDFKKETQNLNEPFFNLSC